MPPRRPSSGKPSHLWEARPSRASERRADDRAGEGRAACACSWRVDEAQLTAGPQPSVEHAARRLAARAPADQPSHLCEARPSGASARRSCERPAAWACSYMQAPERRERAGKHWARSPRRNDAFEQPVPTSVSRTRQRMHRRSTPRRRARPGHQMTRGQMMVANGAPERKPRGCTMGASGGRQRSWSHEGVSMLRTMPRTARVAPPRRRRSLCTPEEQKSDRVV